MQCEADGERIRRFGFQIGVTARHAGVQLVAIDKVRQQRRRHALCEAQRFHLRAVGDTLRAASRARIDDVTVELAAGAVGDGQRRLVQLEDARCAHGVLEGAAHEERFDGLIQQLGFVRIGSARRCVLRMPIAEHGLESFHSRQLLREGNQRFDVDIRVVVVGIDVIARSEALQVGDVFAVQFEES